MRNRLLHLALLALALLVGGLWLAMGGERVLERAAAPPFFASESNGETQDRELALADRSDTAHGIDPPEELEARSTRVVASTERDEELARARWVEGRVVMPLETPADERVKVVARGRKFEHGPAHAVPVAADGSFRVAFAQGTKTGKLELQARYLHLDEPLAVELGSIEPIVLEPRVGGVLRCRVLPPTDAPHGAQELVGKRLSLRPRPDGDRDWFVPGGVRSVELDESLEFVFTALPGDMRYSLECDALVHAPATADAFVVSGTETVVDVQIDQGVSIVGRVLSEDGAASGVEVKARSGGGGVQRRARTDSRGGFELRGIPPGSISLEVRRNGYVPLERDLGRLERGEGRSGLELELSRGLSISGRALWQDGTPAEGATVSATSKRGVVQTCTADAMGAFAVVGLEAGPHRVVAAATRAERVLVTSKLLGRERERTEHRTLRATMNPVDAGESSLQLRFSDGETLHGSVVDGGGSPIARFGVTAVRIERQGMGTVRLDPSTRGFVDAGGAFTLSGLEPGTYSLSAKAEGYLESSGLQVEVPLKAELPPIRLSRTARVAGVVLTPSGEPVAGARVEATGRTSGFGVSAFARVCRTENDGRFEVDDFDSGAFKLRAVHEGFAASEEVEITLAAGGSEEHVTLRLRKGSVLTGVILDASGKGSPLRRVEVGRSRGFVYFAGQLERTVMTDATGAFELPGLEPGTYTVIAPPTDAELVSLGVSPSAGARDALCAKAEVKVGESGGHVTLTALVGKTAR